MAHKHQGPSILAFTTLTRSHITKPSEQKKPKNETIVEVITPNIPEVAIIIASIIYKLAGVLLRSLGYLIRDVQ